MIVLQMQIRMNVNTSKGSTALADSHSNSYIPILSSLSLPLFLNPQILKKKKKKNPPNCSHLDYSPEQFILAATFYLLPLKDAYSLEEKL